MGRAWAAGDGNMPFAFVSWEALQSKVVSEGVTFKAVRAGVAEPGDGDVAYVTCGPFQCATGMDAPAISIKDSQACTDWESSDPLGMGLLVGKVDNDYVASGGNPPYQHQYDGN